MDAPFALLTTFDIVRNQYVVGTRTQVRRCSLIDLRCLAPRRYFYLGENLITYVPGAAFLVVSTFVIVEHATDGNEGLVYGLLSTINHCGQSIPGAVSNQLYGAFYPALSNSANYNPDQGGDQPCFRRVVAYSFLVGYGFAFTSLLTMPLMPNQKADARRRINSWPRRTSYAVATVVLVTLALGYSIALNAMALTPLACLKMVGGQGCDAEEEANVAQPC